ncbi:ATP12 family chaperone protein [Terrarubrum flagellatum]|uniref:ATP12 family chaperone protein n=1 Tax=Terrirubrum flagellatum TaxID=2895980 RepID=UPI003144ED75
MTPPPSPFDIPDGQKPAAPDLVRRASKTPAPKRFWRVAAAEPVEGGYGLTLDGRPARTPSRRPLYAPDLISGERLAAEWNAVGETIDPADMPLTRLINSAIDGVADRAAEVRADIVKYAGSDLLCYRAAEPEKLVARQTELWDPVLRWARERHGARLALAEGVMFVSQPPEAIDAIAAAVATIPAPHALAALHSVTTLTGSAILALALFDGHLDADAAWAAAHVDEDVQMQIWGEDEEALARRALRRREFDAAAFLLSS